MKYQKFDSIRPYNEDEIPAAMQRIACSSEFPVIASFVFPERPVEEISQELTSYKTVREFQLGIMYHANKQILSRSTTEFTFSGVECLSPKKNYLFVSNHRDIMLDASFMQAILTENGFDTCEITFGENLMRGQLVIDVGKSNKMFKVARPGGSPREFYKESLLLSEYIRTTIIEKHQSIWIAQRNGRTKDGIDRTDQGIIKMFGMSYPGDRVVALSELNIVPVAVSYEWESCDVLKTLELYERRRGPYIKKPGEDLNSILTGIMQQKGRVHLAFCEPITNHHLSRLPNNTANVFHRQVANLLDERICCAYRLTPNNYIAHDLRSGKDDYQDRYTRKEKEAFVRHMSVLSRYKENYDINELKDIFLGIYANSVDSKRMFDK
ncbi:MAG: acyltransferase [Bacteroidaceae bacterium]|nr:acyltransferase [Bacteroidaceae bacterium]